MSSTKTSDYLKECIADAVLVLVKNKPIEKITVDELVAKAGVGRATYFRLFRSKQEAITFKFIKMWEQYAELNGLEVRDRFDIRNARDFFEYNYSIRHILDIVYAAGLQEALHDSFYQIMVHAEEESGHSSYREKFYAHGLYGLLDEWIKREYRETPEEMARILVKIINA